MFNWEKSLMFLLQLTRESLMILCPIKVILRCFSFFFFLFLNFFELFFFTVHD